MWHFGDWLWCCWSLSWGLGLFTRIGADVEIPGGVVVVLTLFCQERDFFI